MTKLIDVTDKQLPVLRVLVNRSGEWLRAGDAGDSPSTSGFLAKLIGKGLAERKLRFGSIAWERGNYLYRATPAGVQWIEDHD